MQHQHFLPLTTILLLGAFHGINPGMGWLFAVALGMQERRPAAATATLAHGAGYLLVTAATAWLVFEKVGVGILRKAWFNLDLVWAAALIATGVLTALI